MKKIFALMLALTLCLSFMACGDKEDAKNPTESKGNNTSTELENSGTPKPLPGESSEVSEEADSKFNGDVSIEEAVIVDQDGIKVTAQSVAVEEGIFGDEFLLKVLIENNSDKEYAAGTINTCINGYVIDSYGNETVAAGKKVNANISFEVEDLLACGIETVTDIELRFNVYDPSSWDDLFTTDTIKIQTSAAGSYTQSYDDSGDVLYEGNNVKIISKGLTTDSFGAPAVLLYIENSSDKALGVQTKDESVNDYMVDCYLSCELPAGTRTVTKLAFSDDDLDNNKITAVEKLELCFHAYDVETWEGVFDTDAIKISF
ncbi:MAG: hypothetical protein IJB65_00675 [Clostridia bacterium]|nr:hypothetical protein [Clostridia bacterium]